MPPARDALASLQSLVDALQAATRVGASFVFGFLGGGDALGASANVFLGVAEAPLLIRSFLSKLTRAGLFILITAGFATVAGSVMAVYVFYLKKLQGDILGHIIIASMIPVPAAILMAQVMVPEEKGVVPAPASAAQGFKYESSTDIFVRGVTDGLGLYLKIIGGLTALATDRRKDIIDRAPRALICGTLATLMTGAVIGLIWDG